MTATRNENLNTFARPEETAARISLDQLRGGTDALEG